MSKGITLFNVESEQKYYAKYWSRSDHQDVDEDLKMLGVGVSHIPTMFYIITTITTQAPFGTNFIPIRYQGKILNPDDGFNPIANEIEARGPP